MIRVVLAICGADAEPGRSSDTVTGLPAAVRIIRGGASLSSDSHSWPAPSGDEAARPSILAPRVRFVAGRGGSQLAAGPGAEACFTVRANSLARTPWHEETG